MTLRAYTIICLSKSLLSERNIFGYLVQKQQFIKNIMKIITENIGESYLDKFIWRIIDVDNFQHYYRSFVRDIETSINIFNKKSQSNKSSSIIILRNNNF